MENEQLKTEIKDLLNQIAIKLKDTQMPEVDEDTDYDIGYSSIPVSFKGKYGSDKVNDLDLRSIKAVVECLVDGLEKNRSYDTEKLARAYYSSFCNG